MMNGTCVYCGGSIDAEHDYHAIVGWEKRRSGGGTNAIALRETAKPDRWACEDCINKLKRGVTPEQGSLL
jgi:hypothetical protein